MLNTVDLSRKALCCNVWLTAGRSALHAGVRSALADFIRVAFRVLSPPGHLPTLVGGGYTCIVKQRNSNVT